MDEDSAEEGIENDEIFYTTRATIAKVIHVISDDDPRRSACNLIELAKAYPHPDPELLLAKKWKFCAKCRQRRPMVMANLENIQVGEPETNASSSTSPRPEQAAEQASTVPAKIILRRRRTRVYQSL